MRSAPRARRPRGLRSDRTAAGPGRGQPRTLPDTGHPHRRPHHQHRGHRPVRPHARRRRDAHAARSPIGRADRHRGQRAPLSESLAPAAGAVGRRRHRRRGRQRHRIPRPPAAGLVGRPGRTGARRGAGLADLGGVARRRDGRRRTAARRAPPAHPGRPTSLYVYARETVGYALSIGGQVHSPASGPGTIARLPARSDLLGGTGELESTVSDEAVLVAARKARIIPADGPTSTMTAVLRAARQGNEKARRPGRRTGAGARRSRRPAARHAQPRRSRRRWPGVHRVPGGHGASSRRRSPNARCCRPATSA